MNLTTAEKMRWDLSALYGDINDPRISADVKDLEEKAKVFQANHKGKLEKTLGRALLDYSELQMLGDKLLAYIFLRQTTDLGNPEIKAKSAELERAVMALSGEYLTFFELELVAMEDAVLEKLSAEDPVVLRHKPWIEHVRVFKPHVLSEPVESALVKRSPFGAGAWSEFFDEVESDLEFDSKNEKKTLTEMLHVLGESKNPEERASALQEINRGLGGNFAKYSAQTLYITTGSKSVEDKERNYKNPMEARNKSNRIPDEVVKVLHKVVTEDAAPLAQEHYRLKAKLLGLPRLRWSDRNAPMPFSDTTNIEFSEAQNIVHMAYQSFSPELAKIVERFFDEHAIDAPATKNKRSGAFNSSHVLSGGKTVSFTLLNYLGSNRDVMTLAHELGHGVHGILAGNAQGPLMANAPIAYCETASVFGEMTTFNFLNDRLMKNNNEKARLALITSKIDEMLNTTVRQIGFSNFERRIHGMDQGYKEWRGVKKLSVPELNDIWLETAKELYGPEGDVFTYENTEHLWAYISHFHRPFYVYGYAFGELLTQGLYAKRAELGERFEPLYLEMLRSGGTKNVTELLAPFGLNPNDESFWKNGIKVSLGALLEEAEKLAKELKLI